MPGNTLYKESDQLAEDLSDFLYDIYGENPYQEEVLAKSLSHCNSQDIKDVRDMLENIIDFPETKEEGTAALDLLNRLNGYEEQYKAKEEEVSL